MPQIMSLGFLSEHDCLNPGRCPEGSSQDVSGDLNQGPNIQCNKVPTAAAIVAVQQGHTQKGSVLLRWEGKP